ncbi:MAG: MarR family winged helix-turn-helix transcriptional regulator [Geminicoccaceae bacterium]
MLGRRLDAALAPLGLSAQQFSALAFLNGYGSASISDVAAFLGADRTTVTRNMSLLEKRQLVERAPDADGRIRAMRLSPQGDELFARALPLWREVQAAALARVTGLDPSTLLESLRRL